MNSQPTLQTERLILRPFQLQDAKKVQQLAGDARIAEMTANIPHPYEDGMAESWIESMLPSWKSGTDATFAICLADPENLIGCCGLKINTQHKRAILGYWITTDHWGKGYCTEAAFAIVKFAFSELSMHRVEAQHLTKNPASGAVMRKVGMRHEGTLHGYILKNNQFEDLEQYSILADTAVN